MRGDRTTGDQRQPTVLAQVPRDPHQADDQTALTAMTNIAPRLQPTSGAAEAPVS